MEFKTEEIEVGHKVYRSVDYAWLTEGDSTTFFMRYEGDEIEPLEIRRVKFQDDEQALNMIRMWAGVLYREEKQASD